MTVHSPIPETQADAARKLRVAVFIEHDIIYRHFVQSRVFAELSRRHAVTFVFPEREPANKRFTVTADPPEVGAPMEFVRIDPARLALWRRLFQVSQLRWRPGRDWAHLRKVTRYLVGARASKLYTMLALPGVFQLYRAWSLREIARRTTVLDPLLDRLAPDVIVHPTVLDGYFINDLIMLGRARNIPTIAIMNSWDNPSTKRAVVDKPDWVLVWGPQTQNHAVTYMGIERSKAIAFGAAQFDVYNRAPKLSRDQFCVRHGADPSKRLLLYAGSSKGSDEFEHLQMLEAAIDDGHLSNLAVIYRPHPWGDGGYKGERIIGYPWRHVSIDEKMRPYLEKVGGRKHPIHLPDYSDTHDILSAVDAVVSPLSTILLEGAMHGKPVLCFMPAERQGSSFALQSRLVHFDDLYECPDVLMAQGDEEFIEKTAQLLSRVDDAKSAASLRASAEHFVSHFDRPFSERISTFVQSVAADAGQSRCIRK